MPLLLVPLFSFLRKAVLFISFMEENHMQGEVMWPRLVVNKILRGRLYSNNFVSNFPDTETLLELTGTDEQIASKKSSYDLKDTQKYKVFVSTWNVGGATPMDDMNMEDWLDTRNGTHDIYVLGFQEVVPLSAKNVLGAEKRRISMKWNSLIGKTLNKSLSIQRKNQDPKVGEKQKVYPVKHGNTLSEGFTHDFQCIISKQMVGILVSVWVGGDLRRCIQHPSVSCVGCGIMGCLGNKGSVSVRFCLYETSFCFVCCHLASGGKEGDEIHRNSDAMEIFSRTRFPGGPCLDLPQKILDHDRIILLGDLNYRISLPESRTLSLVKNKEWGTLLENDQLKVEITKGRAFEGWHEGDICFSPTYKYYPNSDEYYIKHKKNEKMRAPAWCDRILWRGEGLMQILYDRDECKFSDHRAVRAIFTAEVDALGSPHSLESFFLSDRYDRLESNRFKLFSEDFTGKGRSSHQS